ncbi:uncharacterized protein B0J16DRAFT_345317 [Fusarium flagelliforme]|uniref:uncharacterized protein n=1 Tax=Fusarium flagelliforme TaxID=2675880 RepID=UPI001E8CEBDE|nr:uncharacterized protein B0J16DRAFT_345317 [Fusarium flagelliforme]KAH7183087.1 hypothetical protein B0J16DRAFT_345317 [Fusarium flagelliforme]
MPSSVKSWFARHCAPPPPLTNNPQCPCTTCFNGGSHSNNSASFSMSSETRPSGPSRFNSDNASLSSATTVAASSYIETPIKQ